MGRTEALDWTVPARPSQPFAFNSCLLREPAATKFLVSNKSAMTLHR